MRFIKASLLALGFIGAFLVGVWTSPYVRIEQPRNVTAMNTATPTPSPTPAAAPARPATSAVTTPRAPVRRIAASSDEVQRHVKPLLNRGTDMKIAASGFTDAEKFLTLAHAARNTQIPFVVLKHRVLEQRMTLAAAIRESKPDLDATREANRAAADARADLARLAG